MVQLPNFQSCSGRQKFLFVFISDNFLWPHTEIIRYWLSLGCCDKRLILRGFSSRIYFSSWWRLGNLVLRCQLIGFGGGAFPGLWMAAPSLYSQDSRVDTFLISFPYRGTCLHKGQSLWCHFNPLSSQRPHLYTPWNWDPHFKCKCWKNINSQSIAGFDGSRMRFIILGTEFDKKHTLLVYQDYISKMMKVKKRPRWQNNIWRTSYLRHSGSLLLYNKQQKGNKYIYANSWFLKDLLAYPPGYR